jgi:hypothetical protein
MEKIAAKKSKFLSLKCLISTIREVVNEYSWTKVILVRNGYDRYRLSLRAKMKDLELKTIFKIFE